MKNGKVKLQELNQENWYECCKLKVSNEQKDYIEPNAISIAQTKFEPTLKPYAIYFEEKVVGFLMYNSVKEELDGYWVYRIMVDKKYQGKGIGKAATELMILEMESVLSAKRIVVGYHPDNKGAHQLYSSLGFVDQGDRFGREMAVIKSMS
ncbi:GNAT family N-acetyltransferase [Rossellomorea sp. AcN35-11]|nr:GNAT family N-acetyltransferase [Rossellomorea aquimaris]WJV29686.1 GNAT family N-acetyltransferase [Rossellomorea sp. AcN35-11]